MDAAALLAAFDHQVRRHPRPDPPDGYVERDANVIRIFGAGWAAVTWSDLRTDTAEAAIAAQLDRFANHPTAWEWKHYSYDQPPDLPDRLRAAGFTAQPTEALLAAEIAELPLDVPPPPGVRLTDVVDRPGVQALVSLHNQVFGGDHSELGEALLAGLQDPSGTLSAVIALAGDTPIAAGRLELHPGTDFASLWGGGTLPGWRHRGVFRALVAHRAATAAAHGYRYLQVDASTDSQPILRRIGFVDLATTTPYLHPGAGG